MSSVVLYAVHTIQMSKMAAKLTVMGNRASLIFIFLNQVLFQSCLGLGCVLKLVRVMLCFYFSNDARVGEYCRKEFVNSF